jgi:hypothetical protein
VCQSEAKASHSHGMWTEVSSSVPHFIQVGLLLSPTIYKCLLKVLCPVEIGPITGPRFPEGSRKLRFPDYVTMAQDGGKVVSLTHRPPLAPGNPPGTHFC